VILVSTPLYHSLAIRLVLVAHTLGAKCVLLDSFGTTKWRKAVQENKVTFTVAVASQLRSLMTAWRWQEDYYDESSLRWLVSSSERMSVEEKIDIDEMGPRTFCECYGTSEVAIATVLPWDAPRDKWESVGKPCHEVEIKIEDEEICVKSPYSTVDGWFKTGDLGRIDEDGYLYYLGRKDDVIITGGINVYPKDVEDVILSQEFVKDCAVIGTPDETLGEQVTAVIVSRLAASEIRRHCYGRLANYQPELPRNATGKVSRKELKKCLSD
jgi:long-chain acyl-CoA synthetase